MARTIGKSRVREIPLSEVKDNLSHLLREAAKGDIVIARHGKPAGVLIGFKPQAKNLFSVIGYLQKRAGVRLHVA